MPWEKGRPILAGLKVRENLHALFLARTEALSDVAGYLKKSSNDHGRKQFSLGRQTQGYKLSGSASKGTRLQPPRVGQVRGAWSVWFGAGRALRTGLIVGRKPVAKPKKVTSRDPHCRRLRSARGGVRHLKSREPNVSDTIRHYG